MASESTATVFAEARRSYEEDKDDKVKEGVEYKEDKDSEILEGLPEVNASDFPFDVIPDGGLTAWTTAFGVFLIQFCGFGYTSSFGVYQDFYSQNYLVHESSSAISWIGSINAFLVVAVCLISGSLYDRGYFYHVVIAGSILQSFSLFMLSLVQPNQYYQIFLAQGISSGIASGLMYIPSMAVISHHFRRRRVLVMGFAASGSALGAIVHPIMLNNLINGPVGFANGVRASAGLVSGLLFIACLCVRTRLPPPETPVNYIAVAKRCIHDVPLLFMIAGGFFFQTGFFYPIFFLQLDSIQHGINTTFSFYSLVILNAANVVGRVLSGFIAGRTGVPALAVIATFSCGIIILSMIALDTIASVVVIGVLYGFFSGIYIAMYTPLMATLTPDFSELGGRMGICSFLSGFGSLIGTPIAGALLTSKYIWWSPALFSGLMALTGGMLYGIMRILFVRRQKKQAMKS